LPCGEQKRQNRAHNEKEYPLFGSYSPYLPALGFCRKAGWSLGWVSAVDSEGRTIWIVDAHRDNGKRFVVRSDEMLSAFLELERITHELALSALLGDNNN
jgi:hypothetical protein